MYLYAEGRFTIKEDFSEVKTTLAWLAESWLPVGTPYTIWYDPDTSRAYGRGVKSMRLQVERHIEAVTDHAPPLWDAVKGLYRVCARIAQGEPPALPDNWRARAQLRHNAAEELQSMIDRSRGEQENL